MVLVQPPFPSSVLERIDYSISAGPAAHDLDTDLINPPSQTLSFKSTQVCTTGEHPYTKNHSKDSNVCHVGNEKTNATLSVQLVNNGNKGTNQEDKNEEIVHIEDNYHPNNEGVGEKENIGYKIRKIVGRGCGVIATKRFYPGDLIIREKPIIVMPDKIFSLDDLDCIEVWLDKRINKMTCEDRASFFELSDSRSSEFDEETKEMDKTGMGIFFTNDMAFIDDSAALFPTISRVNHACTPTSEFITRQLLGVQDLVAVDFIEVGDEITLSYIPANSEGSAGRQIRTDYLVEWYGFKCVCRTCSLTGALLEENDNIRRKIGILQGRDLNKLTLLELDDLVDGLRLIDAKMFYQKQVLDIAIEKALDEHNMNLSAKFFASSYIVASVIQDDDEENSKDTKNRNLLNSLNLRPVKIGESHFLFPAQY